MPYRPIISDLVVTTLVRVIEASDEKLNEETKHFYELLKNREELVEYERWKIMQSSVESSAFDRALDAERSDA